MGQTSTRPRPKFNFLLGRKTKECPGVCQQHGNVMFFERVVTFYEQDFLERLSHIINQTVGAGEGWTVDRFEDAAKDFIRGLHCGEITDEMCSVVVNVLSATGGKYLERWSKTDLMTIVQGAAPAADAAGTLPSMIEWLERILEDPRLPNFLYQDSTRRELLDKIITTVLEVIITDTIKSRTVRV